MRRCVGLALLLVLTVCTELESAKFKFEINVVYPGTKWCGEPDKAKHYNDLGRLRELDKCCRTHDHCPDFIGPFKKAHGLLNLSIFSRLSCKCDEEFRQCLRNVKSHKADATAVGTAYFTILRKKCFKRGCRRRKFLIAGKCVKYGNKFVSQAVYKPK